MAEGRLTVTLDVRGLDRMRLLLWELQELASEMRVSVDPYAERLTGAIERFESSLTGDEPEAPE